MSSLSKSNETPVIKITHSKQLAGLKEKVCNILAGSSHATVTQLHQSLVAGLIVDHIALIANRRIGNKGKFSPHVKAVEITRGDIYLPIVAECEKLSRTSQVTPSSKDIPRYIDIGWRVISNSV